MTSRKKIPMDDGTPSMLSKKSNKKARKTEENPPDNQYPLPIHDIHFKGIEDCRRLLSVVTNLVRKDLIRDTKAKLLCYLAVSMIQVFEKTEIMAGIKEAKEQLDKYEIDRRK